jgi:hypothetical protein
MPLTNYFIDLGELGEREVEVDYHFAPARCNNWGHPDIREPDDPEEFEINSVQLILPDRRRVPLGGLEAIVIEWLGDPGGSGFYDSVTQEDDEP